MSRCFAEIDMADGKILNEHVKIDLKKRKVLSIDDILDVFRNKKWTKFKFYTLCGRPQNIIYAISKHKLPRIFIIKILRRDIDGSYLEKRAYSALDEMTVSCKEVIAPGKLIYLGETPVLVMEYFDGDLYDIVSDLYEDERREILKRVTKAVECLYDKGFIYTDLKIDQVLFRSPNEIRLSDLELPREGEESIYQYKPPIGFFRGGYKKSDEKLINWGLLISVIQLWTHFNNGVKNKFYKVYRHPKKAIHFLSQFHIPDDIRKFIEVMYFNWDKVEVKETFEALKAV